MNTAHTKYTPVLNKNPTLVNSMNIQPLLFVYIVVWKNAGWSVAMATHWTCADVLFSIAEVQKLFLLTESSQGVRALRLAGFGLFVLQASCFLPPPQHGSRPVRVSSVASLRL